MQSEVSRPLHTYRKASSLWPFGFGEAPRESAPGQSREECTEEDYG